MENKGRLAVIAVILIGIFAVLFIQMNQESESLTEQVSEAF